MNAFENDVRMTVYRHFVDNCHAPGIEEVADALGADNGQVLQAYENLAEEHVIVLQPDRRKLRMAMPFSAIETSFRVRIGDSAWFANCAWDALGIAAMMSKDAVIDTRCPVVDDDLQLQVKSGELDPGQIDLVHFVVPAARWWEDIAFT
jgi:hypothetical protein